MRSPPITNTSINGDQYSLASLDLSVSTFLQVPPAEFNVTPERLEISIVALSVPDTLPISHTTRTNQGTLGTFSPGKTGH